MQCFDLWGLILALFSENCKGHCNSMEGMTKSLTWPHTFYENEMQWENPRLLVNPSNKSSQETQKIYSGKIHKPRNWLKSLSTTQ